ncbi:DNA-directed RNA polymerase II subunit [Exophiala xenobiotica]|uniref:DNA-directed RNA polymerase subunit n=1 Tax=Lithohypha guttulata TaxID=1690604 RepID=A0ABR0K782_9EURO|nr:DNA-directed RNA polymerase II subunit [Lithohypha guttulata]KAK5314691.1 DNA-directed RNA polymerase II subunit [Exophiala xenobiotica]
MFFLRYLEREISLHPSFLGNNINDFLQRKLYEDMEGSCNGEYYIICIMDIYNISAGKVRPGTGIAEFTILYRAILWKPFKGEAIDCVVQGVKPQGVFCEAGPLSVFVSKMHLPRDYKYNPDATPVNYSGPEGDTIQKGQAVRVQILGLRSDVNQLFAIGKMSAGWFGLLT